MMNTISDTAPYIAICVLSKQIIKRGIWANRKRIGRWADKRDIEYGKVITITRLAKEGE